MKLFRSELNVGIFHPNMFQNKQALVSTKHCRVWQKMIIIRHFIAELGGFNLITRRILANLYLNNGNGKRKNTDNSFFSYKWFLIFI